LLPKPFVVYWNNIPSPYMVERFEAIARRDRVRLEVWLSKRTEADRSWLVEEDRWQFPFRYLPSVRDHRYRGVAVPTPIVTSAPPDVLVCLHAEPAFVLGWALARRRGVRTVLWVEPTYDAWVRRRAWKEWLKRRIFPSVDAVITTGRDGRTFALRYGARDKKIFYLPGFSSFPHFANSAAEARKRRELLRREMGLAGVAFLYVGRLWRGKGLTYLLDAFSLLQRRRSRDVSLVLAGDGPEEARLREFCTRQDVRNVLFPGFQQRDALPSLYAACDVFVFPTLGDPFGQVVEEAMSCGLPVISTESAGQIRDRIADGVEGLIVAPESSLGLMDAMERLADDDEKRTRMGEASARRVASLTPESWAEQFEDTMFAVINGTVR
jgi:glycosyltransferase involved in cell wall biosynthesis